MAIELIAARLSLYSLPQLSQQLSNRLRLLSSHWRDLPPRHQTMHSAIAWSCELLTEAEKSLFYRMAVFPGSFSLEVAEAVCGAGELDVFSGLESLLDKHLVNRQEDERQSRFWLFETLREFGLEQLAAKGELEVLQSNHAAYYAQLVGKSTGQDYALWDLERHNLRAAFNWAIDHQDTRQAYIFGIPFFAWERQVFEGRQLISRALALPFTQALVSERWWVIYGAVALALFSRDFPAAGQLLDELGALSSLLNQKHFDFYHKFLKSLLFTGLGDFDAAVETVSEAPDPGEIFSKGLFMMHLSVIVLQTHHYARVKELIQEAKNNYQQVDNVTQTKPYLIDCASILGYTALEEHQPDLAVEQFRQAFKLALELSVFPRVGTIYQGLGVVAMQSGNLEESVHWMSLAETIAKATGLTARIMLDKLQERYMKELKDLLDPALFNAYWEDGQRLSMDQAIAFGKEHLLPNE